MEKLCDDLDDFCHQHGLEPEDAGEMLCNEDLTEVQREWLEDFVRRWDQMEYEAACNR